MSSSGFIVVEEARFTVGEERIQEIQDERGRKNLPAIVDDAGRTLTPIDCHDHCADFSPDGTLVIARSLRESFQRYGYWGEMDGILGEQVFWALDAGFNMQLFVLNDLSRAQDKYAPAHRPLALNAYAPAWSPEGDHIAFGEYLDMGRGCVLWEEEFSSARRRALGHFPAAVDLSLHGALTYSPDGKWVMVQSWRMRAMVHTTSRALVDLSAQFESCSWFPAAGPSCVIGTVPTEQGLTLKLLDLATWAEQPMRSITNPNGRPINLRTIDVSADGRFIIGLTSGLHDTVEYDGKAYERPPVACVLEVESGTLDLPLGHAFRTPNADRSHLTPRWRQRPRPGSTLSVAEEVLRASARLTEYDPLVDQERRYNEWLACETFCFAPTVRGEDPPALLPFALWYAEAANTAGIQTSGLEAWIGFFIALAESELTADSERKRQLSEQAEAWLTRAHTLGCSQAASPEAASIVESMRRQTANFEYNEATEIAMFVVPPQQALAEFTRASRTRHDQVSLVADHDRWVDNRGKWQCSLFVFRHRDTRHALAIVISTDDERSLRFNVFAEAAIQGWRGMCSKTRAEVHDHSMVQPVLDEWSLVPCSELADQPVTSSPRRGLFRR